MNGHSLHYANAGRESRHSGEDTIVTEGTIGSPDDGVDRSARAAHQNPSRRTQMTDHISSPRGVTELTPDRVEQLDAAI